MSPKKYVPPLAHHNTLRPPPCEHCESLPRPAAVIARDNGWVVGTRLVGSDGHGWTVIEITAIGRFNVLASRVNENGTLTPDESAWHLEGRRWRVLADA